MAALALLPGVGDPRKIRMIGDFIDVNIRNLLHFRRHLVRVGCHELGHVVLVGIRADGWCGAILIRQVVVAPDDLVIFLNSPGPEVSLQLARFRIHQGFREAFRIPGVTLAAGLVGDPNRTGIRIKRMRAGCFC